MCRAIFSNRDREPYGLTVAPSARGSDADGAALARHATAAALAVVQRAPRRRNQRRDRVFMGCTYFISASGRSSSDLPLTVASSKGLRYDGGLNHPQESTP